MNKDIRESNIFDISIKTKVKSPVLFIIFNRPEKTFKVFEEIRKVKPNKLFIYSDGPRKNIEYEYELVLHSREVVKHIDWSCDVYTNYSELNSGSAKYGVSNGINWFFSNTSEGIILESDCLPNKSFFYFCDLMLDYYRNDTRIMHISGNNFQNDKINKNKSYYFSRIPFIWGWATWARAWQYYDIKLKNLIYFISENKLCDLFSNKRMGYYWTKKLIGVYYNLIDTWDYQWLFSILSQNGLCITPNYNQVTNIGFDKFALNTKRDKYGYLKYIAKDINKIVLNDFIVPDINADICTFKNVFNPSLLKKIKAIIIDIIEKYK